MHYAQLFESIMLLCFGAAWPTSIYKSYTARSNRGKSIFFLYLILFGYANGVVFQYLIAPTLNLTFFIFFLNIFLVLVDIGLYYRNGYLEKHHQ